MARYGRDLDRGRAGGYREGRNRSRYETDYRSAGAHPSFRGGIGGPNADRDGYYGGMRSDAYGSNWDDFPGEQGWFGAGYAGYPSVEPTSMDMGYERYGTDMGAPGTYTGYTDALEQRGRSGPRRGRQHGARTRTGGTRASEIMTENPEAVTPDTTVVDVAKRMRELDVGIIPVVDSTESKRLRGVITDRDLAIRVLADGKDGKLKVSDCMSEDVETVNKNDSIETVLQVMEREQVRRVPVTDRENRLVGIIAQADVAVDYAEGSARRERTVEDTIERISEPARPQRGRGNVRPVTH